MAHAILKAAAVLVAAGALGIGGWSFATSWHPAPSQYPLQGIDLAENPGSVEWGTVRARGVDFAYLVATSGADRRDAGFEANWAAVPEAGLRRGAVHLFSLCQLAADQANAFNAFVPRAADALPMAIDIGYRDDCTARPDRAVLIGELRTFIKMVESHTRKPVLLRIGKALDGDYQLSAAIDRPVWAIGNLFPPSYAAKAWRMWRASDLRRIDGVTGPVNWDVVAP